MSIVDEKMNPEYKIHKFSKKAMEKLCVEIEEVKQVRSEDLSVIRLAKIEETGKRGPKKILQTYDEKISATFDPDVINCQASQYILKSPLRSSLTELDGKFIIENELLGIYSYGDSLEEAEEMFAEEFDYIFMRYNQLEESKLSEEVKFLKSYLNQIVKSRG